MTSFFCVFYNGTKKEPERQELKLSDLFLENKEETTPSLECTAVVLNINLGKNRELMEKCRPLKEYAEFISIIRKYLSEQMDFGNAVNKAVDFCIHNGILADILQKNRSEVVDMILTEYDEEEFRRAWREDLLNEGFRKGLNNGLSKGIKGTIHACMKFNVPKEDVMQNLMEEFSLSQEEAEKYLEEYWK